MKQTSIQVAGMHEPRLVEAGFQPASLGGILPPGWGIGFEKARP